jgi:deazaflavin-dependent oxidoreductase (nitroreductase family)
MVEGYQQSDHGILTYPDSGWRRALFKWPVHLWRLGLAPLIGHQMVLITHTGRKSGLSRRTMTELYRIGERKYVPSGFGRRSQWVRNMEADPRVTIQTATGVESVLARRVVEGGEILSLMDAVKQRSKYFYKHYLDALGIEPGEDDILAKKHRIYWFRFEPTNEPTPSPLPADLVWLWPVAAVSLSLLLLARRISCNK